MPELARACAANRPACTVENAALVSASYSGPTVPMRYCNLMSVVAGALKTPEEEEQHIRRGCQIQRVESYPLELDAALRRERTAHQRPSREPQECSEK